MTGRLIARKAYVNPEPEESVSDEPYDDEPWWVRDGADLDAIDGGDSPFRDEDDEQEDEPS